MRVFEHVSGANSVRRGKVEIAVFGIVFVYLFAAAIRLTEWTFWLNDQFWLQGNPLLATEDAYAWLAGAAGVGRLVDWPLALLLEHASALSGATLPDTAFWAPLVLAGVPGLLVAAVCIVRGYPFAGLIAGIVTVGNLGYLARTRLGYADTDLFALASITWVAVGAAGLHRYFRGDGANPDGLLPAVSHFLVSVSVAQWLYPSGYPIVVAVCLVAFVLTGFAGAKPTRWFLPVLAGATLLAAHLGLAGLLAGIIAVALGARGCKRVSGVLSAGVFLTPVLRWSWFFDGAFLQQTLSRVLAYSGLGLGPERVPVSDWLLPSVAASIQETSTDTAGHFIKLLATHWSFLVVALIGFGFALKRWPEYWVFAPLFLVGLSGYWFGPRMALYASPVVGLGIGLGATLLLERISAAGLYKLIAQGLVLAMVAGVFSWHALQMRPQPAIQQQEARALAALSDIDHWQGRVWTWWDHGYAAQYFSRMPTLADGASASRQRIFALGKVFGAHDASVAAGIMRLVGRERAAATVEAPDNWRSIAYRQQPLASLRDQTAREADERLDSIGATGVPRSGAEADEFVYVSWHTLRQAQWISYFGRWQLSGGEQGYGRAMRLRPPIELDEVRGRLHTADGVVALASLDVIDENQHYRNRWPSSTGAHAVINNDAGEGFLIDSALYDMMAVQLLLANPAEFSDYFELVVDEFPAARIYRLRK